MNGIKLEKAKWITDLAYMAGKKESPVPLTFRKDFTLKGQVKKAAITATAMGIYTMELNGRRVEDTYFAPYFTSYAHRLQYQSYDITPLLGQENRLTVVVPGQGYYMPTMATACWGDCCVLVPWAEYMARGDTELLKEQYPVMKKFLKAVRFWSELFGFTKTDWRIWSLPFHFGDWCAPEERLCPAGR